MREAWLDRQSVHSEESVVFSGSIGVELDSEGSIVSAVKPVSVLPSHVKPISILQVM